MFFLGFSQNIFPSAFRRLHTKLFDEQADHIFHRYPSSREVDLLPITSNVNMGEPNSGLSTRLPMVANDFLLVFIFNTIEP